LDENDRNAPPELEDLRARARKVGLTLAMLMRRNVHLIFLSPQRRFVLLVQDHPGGTMLKKAVLPVLAAALLYSFSPAPIEGQRGQPVQLPEGNGKDAVQATCTQCHALNLVAGAGYSRGEWQEVFSSMVNLPKDRSDLIADYLGKNFPEKPKPKAVIIPGDVKVTIKEWVVPSLGSRPHDPLATSDGAIWWTGMWANVLGRLDPKTGMMKEYPLKTPKSGPHGLTADKDGNIWYTAMSVNRIGRFDSTTGIVTENGVPRSSMYSALKSNPEDGGSK
jgi:virginiamycin B lyase